MLKTPASINTNTINEFLAVTQLQMGLFNSSQQDSVKTHWVYYMGHDTHGDFFVCLELESHWLQVSTPDTRKNLQKSFQFSSMFKGAKHCDFYCSR